MSNWIGPAGFKSAPWAQGNCDVDEKTGESISGVCKNCSQWDAELKDGFCRDNSCREQRQLKAVAAGAAVIVMDGLPGGEKIIHSKEGKRKVKI